MNTTKATIDKWAEDMNNTLKRKSQSPLCILKTDQLTSNHRNVKTTIKYPFSSLKFYFGMLLISQNFN